MFFHAVARVRGLGAWLSAPADRAAVDVVDMKHFRAAVYDALLDPVAQVAARQRRGRIAEGVRAVRRRLVVRPEQLLLQRQPIHERLAAVIQGAIARPIRLGERIDLDHQAPIAVEVAVALVADLVVVDREFAKAVAAGRAHDPVPTARLWATGARVEIARARWFDDQRAEQPVAGLFAVIAVAVEIVGAFGLVGGDHPLGTRPSGP